MKAKEIIRTWDNTPHIVFHGTTSETLDQILKEGLRERSWVATSSLGAKSYAFDHIAARKWQYKESMNFPDYFVITIELDDPYDITNNPFSNINRHYQTTRIIPPENFVKVDGPFNFLEEYKRIFKKDYDPTPPIIISKRRIPRK